MRNDFLVYSLFVSRVLIYANGTKGLTLALLRGLKEEDRGWRGNWVQSPEENCTCELFSY